MTWLKRNWSKVIGYAFLFWLIGILLFSSTKLQRGSFIGIILLVVSIFLITKQEEDYGHEEMGSSLEGAVLLILFTIVILIGLASSF